MSLLPIQPEIYTFLDFTRRTCDLIKRRGGSSHHTHIGGEIPEKNPMPYNVHIKIRDYLKQNPEAVAELEEYLKNELTMPKYDFTNIEITPSTYTLKKNFFSRTTEYSKIDVSLYW